MQDGFQLKIGDIAYVRFHRGSKPLSSSQGKLEEYKIIEYCGHNLLSHPVYRIKHTLTGREHTADEAILVSQELAVAEKLMGECQ